ncbi:uncharacterized protein EV422DRAFT_519052 [Fimicolochytrium jonesii]|uniref:uncharacterized protein n=1 Tax=Fimicolochytrium jonesii TaxID=1396493 RepID=UPI0022FDB9EC|nr:uncharacterized protein EV422DRAFT_519052 [Fimicolochytrium jonesii]KAI8824141.1 hypothetical protein EV422DRAFT_519052 [Fimicolochytrium jonesii]
MGPLVKVSPPPHTPNVAALKTALKAQPQAYPDHTASQILARDSQTSLTGTEGTDTASKIPDSSTELLSTLQSSSSDLTVQTSSPAGSEGTARTKRPREEDASDDAAGAKDGLAMNNESVAEAGKVIKRRRKERKGDTSVLDAANRIFPEYLRLTNELFAGFEGLAPGCTERRDRRQEARSSTESGASKPILEHPTKTLRKLLALGAEKDAFVARLTAQQKLQDEVDEANMQLLDIRAGTAELCRLIGRKRREGADLLDEARPALKQAKAAAAERLNVEDLTSYAIRLSKFTMEAPVLGRGHEPPIPQEHHMRMSLLFQQGHGLGRQTTPEAKEEKTPEHVLPFNFIPDGDEHKDDIFAAATKPFGGEDDDSDGDPLDLDF